MYESILVRAVPHSADLPRGVPEGALPVLGCCMMCLVMATPLQASQVMKRISCLIFNGTGKICNFICTRGLPHRVKALFK